MHRNVAETRAAGDESTPPIPSVLWPAMRRFVVFGLVAVVVLMLTTFALAARLARQHALAEAERQGIGLATRIAAPLVNEDVRNQVVGASAELDDVMDNRMRDGSVSHIKMWSSDGTIIWSDEEQMVGEQYELNASVERLFGTRDAKAEVTDLSNAENELERPEGELLEVYVGTFDADGVPMVFEAYLDTQPMKDNAQDIVRSFVPLIAGSLVLMMLVVLPLAVTLSRRVERGQRDRARLMRHAVLASELERRRIARDLHDGVVQELAGVGYSLPLVGREMHPDGDLDEARTTLDRLTGLVQRNVVALRQFMTDIYPPDLTGTGLGDAIHQTVLSESMSVGLAAHVDIDDDLVLPSAPARLTHRVVREAMRNVVKHAEATQVDVSVVVERELVEVRVTDDGRGLDEPGSLLREEKPGHLGLRLLADTVRDVGGTFDVTSPGPGLGTRLVAVFPRVIRGL